VLKHGNFFRVNDKVRFKKSFYSVAADVFGIVSESGTNNCTVVIGNLEKDGYRITVPNDYLEVMMAHNDEINHPKHYTSHPSGVECIQITRHMNFNDGNTFKYLWRAGLKGVSTDHDALVQSIKDHKKAQWYLNDEIAQLEKKLEQLQQSAS
jgi:hypothetical protein